MLDLGLSEDSAALRRAVSDFCAGLPADGPVATHSPSVSALLAARGWWGLTIPPAYGGSGGGMLDTALFVEAFCHGEAPAGGYLSTFIVVAALLRFGSEEQKRTLLEPVARDGDVLAIAVTEPGTGSDVASVALAASPDGDGWRLDGDKRWCSYASVASHIVVLARTGGEKHAGLTMFVVPRDAPGLTITPLETMLGSTQTTSLRLDGVVVGPDALLGVPGDGWQQVVAGFNAERIMVAAQALGLAQRTFDDALAYVKDREAFGQPIGSFQAQQHRFAQLATELCQVRLLVRQVARMADEEPDRILAQEASMAKLAAGELAKRVALEAVQAMGANGYATEFPAERRLRMAMATTLYGGTSEIQRTIIARTLGL